MNQPGAKAVEQQVREAFEEESLQNAREVILRALLPGHVDHFLLSALSIADYEETKYEVAERNASKALDEASRCPLAIWAHASALDMTLREARAINEFSRLVRGDWDLEHQECLSLVWDAGEGVVADAYFRMGNCYREIGELRLAAAMYERAIECTPGDEARISPRREVYEALEQVRGRETQVWILPSLLRAGKGSGYLRGASGAYATALCLARNEKLARELLERACDSLGLELEVEEAHSLWRWLKLYEVSEESLQIARDLCESAPVGWTLYTYQSDRL